MNTTNGPRGWKVQTASIASNFHYIATVTDPSDSVWVVDIPPVGEWTISVDAKPAPSREEIEAVKLTVARHVIATTFGEKGQ